MTQGLLGFSGFIHLLQLFVRLLFSGGVHSMLLTTTTCWRQLFQRHQEVPVTVEVEVEVELSTSKN